MRRVVGASSIDRADLQTGEIGDHVTVRRRHDRRRPSHHVIARENRRAIGSRCVVRSAKHRRLETWPGVCSAVKRNPGPSMCSPIADHDVGCAGSRSRDALRALALRRMTPRSPRRQPRSRASSSGSGSSGFASAHARSSSARNGCGPKPVGRDVPEALFEHCRRGRMITVGVRDEQMGDAARHSRRGRTRVHCAASAWPASMIATSPSPTMYVPVPLNVNLLGLLATTRRIRGATRSHRPYSTSMS